MKSSITAVVLLTGMKGGFGKNDDYAVTTKLVITLVCFASGVQRFWFPGLCTRLLSLLIYGG